MKKVPATNSRYSSRSRGGHMGSRELSTPETATPPASEVRHPSQLPPKQRPAGPSRAGHVHLMEVKYCEDTRPKNRLEAFKQQHSNLCCDLSRASAQVTLQTILLGVGGAFYTPHILEPLKELDLDIFQTTKLSLKLHTHSVQYAYELAGTRRALESTPLNSHHQDQARATAINPPDPHYPLPFSLGEGDALFLGPRYPLFLN
eukprot:1154999-Pelagomonas_calceolata.AAC.5